jgi:hypothetical protein
MNALDRANLALAGLAVMLVALLRLQDAEAPSLPPLTTQPAADVHEITLFRGPQLAWSLLRDAEGWMLTHPQVQRASAERVSALLGVLQTPSLERFPAPAALGPYGLEAPGFRLSFDGRALSIGGTEPTTGHRYVLWQDQVHLIGDGYYPYLAGGWESLSGAED